MPEVPLSESPMGGKGWFPEFVRQRTDGVILTPHAQLQRMRLEEQAVLPAST
jgi:hypothetical protein